MASGVRACGPGILLLGLGHAGLLATFNLADHPVATLVCFGIAMIGLVAVSRRLRSSAALGAATILLVAGLLRLLLLPLPPSLSDDLLRYVWDGRVATAGANPYLLAPDAPELQPLRDDLWERLPHRQVPTVYPPLAIALFSIAGPLPLPTLVLKLLLSGLDLVTCWLLVAVADARGLPRGRVVWYAWNPLAVLEVAGMGHVDALGVAAVTATVLLLVRGRFPAAAGVTAAAAALAKLVPLAAFPLWARRSGRPVVFLGAALGAVAVTLAPVAVAATGVPPGYARYAVSWEFNGPLYEPLWRLLETLESREAVAATLDGLKERTGAHDFWNRFYPYNYARLHARLLLAVGLAVALVAAWRHPRPIAGTGLVFASMLVFSSTVYPWYLLWVLPWAALCLQPAWLALSACLPISYLPQVTGLPLMPWVFLLTWAPFGALLAARWRWSTD